MAETQPPRRGDDERSEADGRYRSGGGVVVGGRGLLPSLPAFAGFHQCGSGSSPRHHPEEGAKALLVKADETFYVVVISGVLRLDSKVLRRLLGTRRVRFATEDELLQIIGCRLGAVPPLGNLLHLPVLMDLSLRECERVSFNAGSNGWSVTIEQKNLERQVQPRIGAFGAERAGERPAAPGEH